MWVRLVSALGMDFSYMVEFDGVTGHLSGHRKMIGHFVVGVTLCHQKVPTTAAEVTVLALTLKVGAITRMTMLDSLVRSQTLMSRALATTGMKYIKVRTMSVEDVLPMIVTAIEIYRC